MRWVLIGLWSYEITLHVLKILIKIILKTHNFKLENTNCYHMMKYHIAYESRVSPIQILIIYLIIELDI